MKRSKSDPQLQLLEAREVAEAKSKVKNWIKQTSRQRQNHPDIGSVSLGARELVAALDTSEKRLVQVDSQAVKVRSRLLGDSEIAAIKSRGLSARTRHASLRRSNSESDVTDLSITGASTARTRERSSNVAKEARPAPQLVGNETESAVREWMEAGQPSSNLIPEVELMEALRTSQKDLVQLNPQKNIARIEAESSRLHTPKLSEKSQEGMLDGLGYLYGMVSSSLNVSCTPVQDTSTNIHLNTGAASDNLFSLRQISVDGPQSPIPERHKSSKMWNF